MLDVSPMTAPEMNARSIVCKWCGLLWFQRSISPQMIPKRLEDLVISGQLYVQAGAIN